MGRIDHYVSFDREPPALEEVRARLEKRIGLPVRVESAKFTAWFFAEPFRGGRRVLLGNRLNQLEALEANSLRQSGLGDRDWGVAYDGFRWGYFMWALLATLEELGGHSDVVLPPFVNTQWKDKKWWQRFSAMPEPLPTARDDGQRPR